jgi:hypothetical protein
MRNAVTSTAKRPVSGCYDASLDRCVFGLYLTAGTRSSATTRATAQWQRPRPEHWFATSPSASCTRPALTRFAKRAQAGVNLQARRPV